MKMGEIFLNHSFDKKRLKALISWIFKNFGEHEALRVVELLKETGFHYATKGGISIGLQDLKTPVQKAWLVSDCQNTINKTHLDFTGARITATERSQRIIDTWHRANDSLRTQIVDYFTNYDPFNPVYIMALSGARGNFSQVRQLIGMRGLMADQQGKIVSFPIRSNLREGLTLTEYFISCSGARKGLVDTALRTADTGYLTRRLVDVSHHVVVKRVRCNTHRSISVKALYSYNKVVLTLKERLLGRVLAEDITSPLESNHNADKDTTTLVSQHPNNRVWQETASTNTQARGDTRLSASLVAKKNQEISGKVALKISLVRKHVCIRSPLTCKFTDSVCQLCYGWGMSQGSLVSLGDAVGVIAAQSIGEPGTQLTMRTFHTGGVFSGDLLQEMRAPYAGKVHFSRAFQGIIIRTAQGRVAFLTKVAGELLITPAFSGEFKQVALQKNKQVALHNHTVSLKQGFDTHFQIPALTMLFVKQGETVEKNQLLAEFSIASQEGNQSIKSKQTVFSELSGRVVEDRGGKTKLKLIKLDGKKKKREDDSLLFTEPTQSGRLGFCRILAARIGATFSYQHPIKNLQSKTNLLRTVNSETQVSSCKTIPTMVNVIKHSKKLSSIKNYIHPELAKSNAFCLQTVADYGDVVEEDYQKIVVTAPYKMINSQKQSFSPIEQHRCFTASAFVKQDSLTKIKLVGEIVKERFIDVLYTNREQVSFSLQFKNQASMFFEKTYAPPLPRSNGNSSFHIVTVSGQCTKVKIGDYVNSGDKIGEATCTIQNGTNLGVKNKEQNNLFFQPCFSKAFSNKNQPFGTSERSTFYKSKIKHSSPSEPLEDTSSSTASGSVDTITTFEDKTVEKLKNISPFSQKNSSKEGYQKSKTAMLLTESGKVVKINKNQITLQKTQPVLFYSKANIHRRTSAWVTRGAPILTLTHQTLITGDIVQGIPRIEQLFEAFTSPPAALKDYNLHKHNTLHSQVRDIFRKNWLQNVLPIAVKQSLQEIQQILVESIQKVYLSQGVLIADKHIEIVVRQMTSKVQILDSGSTGFLLEEVVPIEQVENANTVTPGKKALYAPAVVGLSSAALNSDSFVSAASFQETTRVLSRDAVTGKTDFLRGLKEKVVIGDLLSAGTGLDTYFAYTFVPRKMFFR